MRRLLVLLVVGVVVLLGFALNGLSPTSAQDGTPVATASHPLVGAWIVDISTEDPSGPQEATVAPNVTVFTDEGLVLNTAPGAGSDVGAWEATSARGAAMTFVGLSRRKTSPAPSSSAPRTSLTRRVIRSAAPTPTRLWPRTGRSSTRAGTWRTARVSPSSRSRPRGRHWRRSRPGCRKRPAPRPRKGPRQIGLGLGWAASSWRRAHGPNEVLQHALILQRQLALKAAKPGQMELNGAED